MSAAWFEEPLTTRGTEIDETATVSPFTFLRYFEHKRWKVMHEPALGLIDYLHDSHFFVVRTQVMELRRRVGMGVPLMIRTHFEHCGRSMARVLHEAVRVDDGATVARARVTGVWLGADRRMARIPEAFRTYAAMQAALAPPDTIDNDLASDPTLETERGGHARSFIAPPTVNFAPMSVATEPPRQLPDAWLFQHQLTVAPRDLDVFGHVNAATWLHFAHDARFDADRCGALPSDVTGHRWTVRVGLFHAREAVAGETLQVRLWQPAPRALAYAFFLADSPHPLCIARGDYAPGGAPVNAPNGRSEG